MLLLIIYSIVTSKKNPQIWFPNYGKSKNIVIQITENCLNDMDRAVFQVAHETIHCLSGLPSNFVTNFLRPLFCLFRLVLFPFLKVLNILKRSVIFLYCTNLYILE